jgi:putative transposase
MFLDFLVEGINRSSVAVHGYVLMTNHFHLLATPPSAHALPRFMKWLTGRYVQYFNYRRTRMGTIWNGRYKALPVQDERYWLTCLRYIEQNPVRAGLSTCPSAYRWSSARAHMQGGAPEWLASHELVDALGKTASERRCAYRALAGEPVDRSDLELPH